MIPPPSPSAAVEQAFERGIRETERLRSAVLASIYGAAALFFLVITLLFPRLYGRLLDGNRAGVAAIIGLSLLYELTLTLVVHRLLRRPEGHLPAWGRYANALLETSLPTLALIYLSQGLEPEHALSTMPALTYYLFILLSTLRLDFYLALFTGLVAATEYLLLALVLLRHHPDPTHLDPLLASPSHYSAAASVMVVTGAAAGIVARQLRRRIRAAVRTVLERDRVVQLFGQHVSPSVVDKLLAQQTAPESEVRRVCVMFLDLRGFTAFAAARLPDEVVRYLNTLFESMIERVNHHHGIINKFLGDGFMAVFGAPLADGNECDNAVRAALEILAEVEAMVGSGRIPPTRIGVGLHAGEVVTGSVGSPLRKEYTIIGDVVNIASRVEAYNKTYGCQILCTDEVWQALGDGAPRGEYLGLVQLRGHGPPIGLHRLA